MPAMPPPITTTSADCGSVASLAMRVTGGDIRGPASEVGVEHAHDPDQLRLFGRPVGDAVRDVALELEAVAFAELGGALADGQHDAAGKDQAALVAGTDQHVLADAAGRHGDDHEAQIVVVAR